MPETTLYSYDQPNYIDIARRDQEGEFMEAIKSAD